MMDWTDRHCRVFHRQLTSCALLYTEMVTSAAIIHGDRKRLLGFDACEQPVALQLGGCDPAQLAEAARIGAAFGYVEINLNVGCPSSRVQEGRFGACLMREPALVARCFEAMQAAVDIPVTVKCRIGVDEQDAEADLDCFVSVVAGAGCRTFVVHARKAWLKGLSPKENREVPPLDYARVQRLKARNPGLEIVLNGGISNLEEAAEHLAWADGVMLGRAAYQTPYIMAEVDSRLFGMSTAVPTREAVLEALLEPTAAHLANGGRLHGLTRHILGLYHGQRRGRAFRRHLSENAVRDGAGLDVLRGALGVVADFEGVEARDAAE